MIKFSKIVKEKKKEIIEATLKLHQEKLCFDDEESIGAVLLYDDGAIITTEYVSDNEQSLDVFNGEAIEVAKVRPMNLTDNLESGDEDEKVDDYSKEELEAIKEAYWDTYSYGVEEETERIFKELIYTLEYEEDKQ